MLFVCYPKCGTCRKAEKYLEENHIPFAKRMIHEEPPSAEELRLWHEESGLPLRKLFNTSGKLYREMKLSEKLKTMDDEEMIRLLASDGMLVKRPILVDGKKVLFGFREEDYAALKK